jgi:myosin heavy subunit
MLQQHFNNQTFKLEEAIYKQEKIVFKSVAFIDNVPMIELITKKPHGVLPLLDEELVVPKGTDRTFCEKLNNQQGNNKV